MGKGRKRRVVVLAAAVAGSVFVAAGSAAAAPGRALVVPAKTVRSADGQLTVTIPRGALARPTNVRVRALPQSAWPAELRGAQVRAGAKVYSLEPSGLRFSKPVTITRRILDVDSSNGVPAVALTSRDSGGRWAPLGAQSVRVNGSTVSVSATTRHFSTLVTINSGASVDITPKQITQAVDGPGWTGRITVANATFRSARRVVAGAVEFDEDEPAMLTGPEEYFFCDDVGRGSFGARVAVEVDVRNPVLLVLLGGRNRVGVFVFVVQGSANCSALTTLQLVTACVLVTHNPYGAFASYLTYVLIFSALGLPPSPRLELLIGAANNDAALSAPVGANGRAELLIGINSFGPKPVRRASVNGVDITQQLVEKIGTPEVGSGQGRIAGSC